MLKEDDKQQKKTWQSMKICKLCGTGKTRSRTLVSCRLVLKSSKNVIGGNNFCYFSVTSVVSREGVFRDKPLWL